MPTNSIRWRLQLWLAFLLVCVLSGFGVTAYQWHRLNQFNLLDGELERRVAALSTAVRGGPAPPFGPGRRQPNSRPDPRPDSRPGEGEAWPGPPPPRLDPGEAPGPGGPGPRFPPREFRPRELRLGPEDSSLFAGTEPDSFYFAVWFRDGTWLQRSSNAPVALPLPARRAGDTRTHIRMRDPFREAYHFTELGDCVLAGRSTVAESRGARAFAGWLLAAGGAVLALGLGGGWWLTTRAIRPVEKISAAASRISAGNLSERIQVANPTDELGRLAAVLNSTFARLEAAFVQQKQFTADASHELRTPLAVLISEAQTSLARERTAAEYREALDACLNTAQQMRRLTESLLQLARFDTDQEKIPRGPIDLSVAALAGIESLRPLATQRGLKIHCELAPAHAWANSDRVGQVITNLLTNAIQYSGGQTEIQVRTCRDGDFAVLSVTDQGIGISPQDLPHVFERFYRADKARSRADGHAGLGLAICQAIMQAEGGDIEGQSQVGTGTTFTARFPAAQEKLSDKQAPTGPPGITSAPASPCE